MLRQKPLRPEKENKEILCLSLHCLPKVICVEESREFGIDVDDMNVPLAAITDYRLVVVARLVGFNVDTERAVYFQSQSRAR